MTAPPALLDRLAALSGKQPFSVTWSLVDLRTAAQLDLGGDAVVPAASTRKIAILMACLARVAAGTMRLDQRLVIEARHQNNDSGCLRFLRPGLSLTLFDALTLMIIVSDNCCTAAILELIDLDEINRYSRAAGMVRTRHVAVAPASSLLNEPTPAGLDGINTTTANDVAGLLAAIVAGSRDEAAAARLGCDTRLCRMALDILAGQQFRCGLPRLLPTGTRVAHKTGVGPSNESDAGVVYRDGIPIFALAVYTHAIPVTLKDGLPGRAIARDHIAELARQSWVHL